MSKSKSIGYGIFTVIFTIVGMSSGISIGAYFLSSNTVSGVFLFLLTFFVGMALGLMIGALFDFLIFDRGVK